MEGVRNVYLAISQGNFQFAPNFLWQKPLVGPISNLAPEPARPRNVLDDPSIKVVMMPSEQLVFSDKC